MANILCLCLQQIVLPICMLTSIVIRPSGLSALYLLFLLYLPLVPIAKPRTLRGHTGIYLKLLISVSVLTTVLQLAFQIVLLSMPPYGHFLKDCELTEKILRHVGFVGFKGISVWDCFNWLLPDVLMVIASVAVYVLCRRLVLSTQNETTTISEGAEEGLEVAKDNSTTKLYSVLSIIGKYLCLAALCLAAILRPSVQGGLYFLVFLTSATWWACYRELQRKFAYLLRVMMGVVFLHIVALYAYQFQWPQEFLPGNSTYARYFGLTPILQQNCSDPRTFIWNDVEYPSYLNPFFLYILFYLLATESKLLLMPQVRNRSRVLPAESTPLIRGVSPSRRYGSGRRTPSLIQDSTGSVILRDGNDDIPMQQLGAAEENYKSGILENIIYGLESVFQVLVQRSYIATNIIMMAWSITYHSWITFVLLLWANIIWMIPNQRRSMLKCSPFLVVYAWFLLLSAYIYSMNLTEDELPSVVKNINLAQIGFQKILVLPYVLLLVKCLYTTAFWITLRQYMKERKEARQSSALADMVAPLQVTVGAATTAMKKDAAPGGNKIMKIMGDWIWNFLTKFWIWVVAITLYTVAITGNRMTGFRIIYMALFLIFILTFQLSFNIWRKIMFGFWLTVIVYSMLILVMVYTYQFDHFPDYWRIYLKVPDQQQLDIGLEIYDAKQLFVRLLTPTFFVVITVIQLHYFHKAFLELSKPRSRPGSTNETRSEASSAQAGAWDMNSERHDGTKPIPSGIDLRNIKNISSDQIHILYNNLVYHIGYLIQLFWLIAEIHVSKIVLLCGMLLCIKDVSAINMIIIFLILFAFTLGSNIASICTHISSIFVSLLLLTRMIYQIEYIKHDIWTVNCTYPEDRTAVLNNTAEWLGFRKTSSSLRLSGLVKWNIIFMLAVTFRAIVLIRRRYTHKGHSAQRKYFMFPKIKREDADKSIRQCLQYFANYGFYKFGVEISLIATVALIGIRMDLYAIFYGIWLAILFSLSRPTLAKVWIFYLIFVALILPIQYFMVVGLPPNLCIVYPWDNSDILRRMQEWAFLLDIYSPPSAKKLICDFVVLLFVTRQYVVFRIEARFNADGTEYPGGSNESIVHLAEDKDFVNPVPDFITYIRSYLDIFKRGIFQSFLWITLAIMFLTGTNRVNLFSLGYLIGSFVFLWHGSDIYLKPIPTIIKSWNWLLGYNVTVIVTKTILQITGCIFMNELQTYTCWLVQLLGIGCVRKFQPTILIPGMGEECTVPREYIGLAWDGVCFAFLILQRRLFQSYNFFHLIDDSKATTVLASRGAELIEELRVKRILDQDDQERKILEKIKQKMDKIKANQQKIQGPNMKESVDHYVDKLYPKSSRPHYRRKSAKSYKEAIRSGDYYMFYDMEEDDDLEIISEPSKVDMLLDEQDSHVRQRGTPTVGQLLDSAIKTDIQTTLNDQMSSWDIRRRSSVPIFERTPRVTSTRSQLSAPLPGAPSEQERPRTVHISEDIPEPPEEPQPSTSKKDIDQDSELSTDSTKQKQKWWQSKVNLILFAWAFIVSCMISCTNFLNRFTRDYRYVIRVLAKEKRQLKDNADFRIGIRTGSAQAWQPSGTFETLIKSSRQRLRVTDLVLDEIKDPQESITEIKKDPQSPTTSVSSSSDKDLLDETEMSYYDQPPILRMLLALWFTILSHTDWLCYFIIFLNQIKSASFLSLPLPLMVFLWGTMTIPRPSKSFWITLIAYTEAVVLLKCIFQIDIFPWNTTVATTPFFPPRILGIERKNHYATYDLILLLFIFFHRYMLKCLGLWKTTFIAVTEYDNGEYILRDGKMVPATTSGSTSSSIHLKERRGTLDLIHLVDETSKDDQTQPVTDDQIVMVKTEPAEFTENVPGVIQLGLKKYGEEIKIFFQRLMDPTSRVADDIYAYMFMCDFFNFMVVIFGFSAFGTQQGDGGVSSYLEENKVPVPFLLMLILQFMLIIVDRALYLRKYILGKVVFQFLQIIGVHIWMFFILPAVTDRSFNTVLPPQMWYMVKCFYLLLSAYQIRCGYPTRILGNFLCKAYNYVNFFLFKFFMAIPFLFELRTIMDWMWTDTSMTIMDWLKMEDIFAHIFSLKCSRWAEAEYPQARGEKKSPIVKYLTGGGGLIIIIAVIWFPLVFFALGNTVGHSSVPIDVTVTFRIGPYQPIYQMSAQTNAIYSFTPGQFDKLVNIYNRDRVASTFLSAYEGSDVAAVKLNGNSTNVWSISPPDKIRMLNEINSTNPLLLRLQYQVTRKSTDKQISGVISEDVEITLPGTVDGEPSKTRQQLVEMLQGSTTVPPILMKELFPKFVKVTNRGTAKPVNTLLASRGGVGSATYRNISVLLSRDEEFEWWELREDCSDDNYLNILNKIPYANCEYLVMYTFNDKTFPASLSFFTGGGIIGLYTTLVFVVSRFFRGFFSEICFKIMFDDMPNVDRIMQLCLNIYLVRESREFCLEEDLFAKLVFLFRSPETLILWTRSKDEGGSEDDEDEDDDDNEQQQQLPAPAQ